MKYKIIKLFYKIYYNIIINYNYLIKFIEN